MPKKSSFLSASDRKLIKAKFSITPEAIAADLARDDAARAKTRKRTSSSSSAKPRSRGSRGVGAMDMEGMATTETKYYPDFPLGQFVGQPHLVWVSPDRFRHEPDPADPFRFIRADGEVIQPGVMITDGGSIPRSLWFIKDLSPWSYGPAFLIHDWLFEQHHCGNTKKPFDEVRDILMEGVRTLMETGVCDNNRLAFDAIYAGVDSVIAKKIWEKGRCS
jgi:hypothetical protein